MDLLQLSEHVILFCKSSYPMCICVPMDNSEIVRQMSDLYAQGRSFVLATVVSAEGSTLAKPGFKVVLSEKGEILKGTLGGACPESAIAEAAARVLSTGAGKSIRVHLDETSESLKKMSGNTDPDEIYVETFCGGTIEIFLEPYLQQERIVLVKQGGKEDVAEAISSIAQSVSINCNILDLSVMQKTENGSISDPLTSFHFRPTDSVVILTKGNDDLRVLRHLAKQKVAYIGLMASRKRSAHDFEQLKSELGDAFLQSICTPIGVDIGAVFPWEIAVSIVGEIISAKRKATSITEMAGAK